MAKYLGQSNTGSGLLGDSSQELRKIENYESKVDGALATLGPLQNFFVSSIASNARTVYSQLRSKKSILQARKQLLSRPKPQPKPKPVYRPTPRPGSRTGGGRPPREEYDNNSGLRRIKSKPTKTPRLL